MAQDMSNQPQEDSAFIPRFKVKHHFEFDIGQRVIIKGSNIEADVTRLIKEDGHEQYEIAWWYSGARISAWVYGREIFIKAKK